LALNGFLNSKAPGETKCKIDDIKRCVKGFLCFAYNFIWMGLAVTFSQSAIFNAARDFEITQFFADFNEKLFFILVDENRYF
tara:strand:+ start:106 stop:351 length:246 start_codon:yes stop_codon:yes gene_type:complete